MVIGKQRDYFRGQKPKISLMREIDLRRWHSGARVRGLYGEPNRGIRPILQVEGAAVIVRPEDVAVTTHRIADIVRLGGIHAKETMVILLADGHAPPTMFGLIQAEGPCHRDRLEHPTLWWNLRNQVGHGPVAVFPPSYPRGLAEHPHLYRMRRKGVLAGPERDCVHHTGHVERKLFRT